MSEYREDLEAMSMEALMTVLIPKKNGIEYAWDSHLLYFEEEIQKKVEATLSKDH
jgi:hypothetical protein